MSDVTRAEFFEPLESRVMLSYDPATFPDLADLASENNTVIRFNTDAGFIDIELFDRAGPDGNTGTAAPNTSANFLNYILDGDFDGSFFHRMEALNGVNGQAPDILQGGGFRFTDADGVINIDSDDPVDNEFDDARSNIERTLAMAKLGGDPDSATSQFFFNLRDNSAFLDDTNADDIFDNGGFTVFGRVADDASWNNLMAIMALDEFNFADVETDVNGDETLPLTPLPDADPQSFAFTDVPIDMPVSNVPPGQLRFGLLNEGAIVTLLDAEVIKTAGTNEYYTRTVYYPEGYANQTISETITVSNFDANAAIDYQVILRYETGNPRDVVIASGLLEANATTTIQIDPGGDVTHDGGALRANLIRTNVPYAFEVQATSESGRFGAQLLHSDFGSTGMEQFLSDENYTSSELLNWNVTTVQKSSDDIRSFIVWQNISENVAEIEAIFYDSNADGSEVTVTFDVDAFRRGGINVNAIPGLLDGIYAVRILSNEPIMVAHSQYEVLPNFDAAPVTSQRASLSAATAGNGRTSLVLTAITLDADGGGEIRLYNPNTTQSVVTVMGSRGDGTSFNIGDGQGAGLVILPPRTSRAVDLDNLVANNIISDGETLTITLDGTVPFTAQFRSLRDGDQLASRTLGELAQVSSFSGVHFDPNDASITDTLSIFNTKSSGLIRYRIDVLFADGSRINGVIQNLNAFTRVDLTVNDLPNAATIIARINDDPANSTFSYSVLAIDPSDSTAGAGLVQLTRVDTNMGYTATTMGRFTGTETAIGSGTSG